MLQTLICSVDQLKTGSTSLKKSLSIAFGFRLVKTTLCYEKNIQFVKGQQLTPHMFVLFSLVLGVCGAQSGTLKTGDKIHLVQNTMLFDIGRPEASEFYNCTICKGQRAVLETGELVELEDNGIYSSFEGTELLELSASKNFEGCILKDSTISYGETVYITEEEVTVDISVTSVKIGKPETLATVLFAMNDTAIILSNTVVSAILQQNLKVKDAELKEGELKAGSVINVNLIGQIFMKAPELKVMKNPKPNPMLKLASESVRYKVINSKV